MNEKLCDEAEIINQEVVQYGFSWVVVKYCSKDSLDSTIKPYQDKNFKPSYIREPATHYSDLEKQARKSLKHGFVAQDVRINMNVPYAWMNSKSFTRNVQHKIFSWLVLDAPCLADSEQVGDYYQPSLDYIIDWIDTFIATDARHDFAWYDMAVGQRATKLAYILSRALERGESQEVIDKLIVCAEIHIKELSNLDTIALHSNHGLFQMLGLLTLGSQLSFLKSSKQAVNLAKDLIVQMIQRHFCSDGMHSEHSPTYHIYMANFLSILLDSGYIQSKEFEVLASKAIDASQYLVQPDGCILGFGDSRPVPVEMKALFDVHGDGSNRFSPKGLRYFDKYGLVIHSHYKDNKISDYFAFSAAFHSRQHKHADDFNFQFYYKGIPIFVDTGTYTYQYDLPERIYAESTRAHNCVEIDHCNYSRFNKDVFGSAINFVKKLGDCLIIESFVDRKRLMPNTLTNTNLKFKDAIEVSIKHKRLIAYHPEQYLLVIDIMKSEHEHDYTQWFNFDDKLNVVDDKVVSVFDENNTNLLSLTPVGDNKNIQHVRGEVEPKLHGWMCKDGHTLTERSAVGMSCKGTNQTLATLVDLNPSKSKKIFFNSGTNGKYIRFSLARNSDNSIELIYRLRNNCIELSYVNNKRREEALLELD